MNILIRVFNGGISMQIGNGLVHWYLDWVMVLDLIRPEDTIIIQNYTGNRVE